jgi:hypothetical protein
MVLIPSRIRMIGFVAAGFTVEVHFKIPLQKRGT